MRPAPTPAGLPPPKPRGLATAWNRQTRVAREEPTWRGRAGKAATWQVPAPSAPRPRLEFPIEELAHGEPFGRGLALQLASRRGEHLHGQLDLLRCAGCGPRRRVGFRYLR